jgi:hypothetical protein
MPRLEIVFPSGFLEGSETGAGKKQYCFDPPSPVAAQEVPGTLFHPVFFPHSSSTNHMDFAQEFWTLITTHPPFSSTSSVIGGCFQHLLIQVIIPFTFTFSLKLVG